MRQIWGDERIVASQPLRDIYLRLIDFDDLRPQSALLNYLLYMPEQKLSKQSLWETVRQLGYELLEEIHDDPFLTHWLDIMDKQWRWETIDAIQIALDLKVWRWAGIPLSLAEQISNSTLNSVKKDVPPEQFAMREATIQDREALFVIAGHTHSPKVALLARDKEGERYYIDTGTWRNRVPANHDYTAFGKLKTLTYVVLYPYDEDLGNLKPNRKTVSVDSWTGFTQRW